MGETEDERVETPAEASESAKGDLSYHYWHARANAGDAPAATAKEIRSRLAATTARPERRLTTEDDLDASRTENNERGGGGAL